MPVYTYRCENCGHQFDRQQSYEDKPIIVCPNCHKHMLQKVYRPAGVVFKGSGFYVNDKNGKKPGNGASKKPKETGSSEAKPQTKTENKPEKPKAKNEE